MKKEYPHDYPPFKQKMNELKTQTLHIRDNTVNKVSYEITKAVNHYDTKSWQDNLTNVLNIIYHGLADVYGHTKTTLRKTYHRLPENKNIQNIGDLLYNGDGLTLDERCQQYWDAAEKKIKQGSNNQDIIVALTNAFYKIINTEMNFVRSNVKRMNKPLNASYIIIEGGECEGKDHPPCDGGEFDADELIDLPPYHPNCDCDYWYVTDNNDEDDDLEEIENIEENEEEETL